MRACRATHEGRADRGDPCGGQGKQVAAGCQPTADREHERPSPACGSQGSGWITPLRPRVGPLPLAPSTPWRSPGIWVETMGPLALGSCSALVEVVVWESA